MRERREVIRDDEDMLVVAVREISSAIAPIVADLAVARARFIVADEIVRRDLVVRESQEGQPSAAELLAKALGELERLAGDPRATVVGAHDLLRRVGVSMGVHGSGGAPAYRRTRAEVDEAPNPRRRREGTQGLVGGVHRGEVHR